MIYRNSDGIILELCDNGERFFNGEKCTLSNKGGNFYTLKFDDNEIDIELGNEGVFKIFPFVENNNEKTFVKDTTLIIIDCVNAKRAEKTIDICLDQCEFEQIKFLTSLKTNYEYKVEIPEIKNIQEYSKFCIKELWKYIETKFVLIVQHDGYIINGKNWDNSWFNYDYIGCATVWTERDTLKGGNGGFSFRSKNLLKEASLYSEMYLDKCHPEDTFLSYNSTTSNIQEKNGSRTYFESKGFVFATNDIQKKFGIEFSKVEYNMFGHHRGVL